LPQLSEMAYHQAGVFCLEKTYTKLSPDSQFWGRL